MIAAAAQVQAGDRGAVADALRGRADQELIEAVLAVEQVAVGHAVARGEIRGREHLATDDAIGDARRVLSKDRLRAIAQLLATLEGEILPKLDALGLDGSGAWARRG